MSVEGIPEECTADRVTCQLDLAIEIQHAFCQELHFAYGHKHVT